VPLAQTRETHEEKPNASSYEESRRPGGSGDGEPKNWISGPSQNGNQKKGEKQQHTKVIKIGFSIENQ
jgi:hypothetical protein